VAGKPIDQLEEYDKWSRFIIGRSHLVDYEVAKACVAEFGSNESTWFSRVIRIRGILNSAKQPVSRHRQSMEDRNKAFLEFIGLKYPFIPSKSIQRRVINADKLLVLSDPHEPYALQPVFDYVWEHHGDSTHVHVNGDFGDFYSKSRFRKTKHSNYSDELRAVFQRMDWLAARFQKVTITIGNHDDRPLKALANAITTDQLWMTETDLMVYMSQYFDNVEIVGMKLPGKDGQIGWIWQKGDIIFTHVERSAEQPSRILDIISKQLHIWRGVYRFKPYKVIVQGHNHIAMKSDMGPDTLFLMPTCADINGAGLDYIFGPRLIGKPPTVGYAVFYQHNGVTNTNASNYFKVEV
jgi:predicted phosphodiesterase